MGDFLFILSYPIPPLISSQLLFIFQFSEFPGHFLREAFNDQLHPLNQYIHIQLGLCDVCFIVLVITTITSITKYLCPLLRKLQVGQELCLFFAAAFVGKATGT